MIFNIKANIMKIVYSNNKIRKQIKKTAQSSRVLRKRIAQLMNAPCYLDIPTSTGKHFLKGNLKNYFAIYFGHPARLICEPIGEFKNKNGQFIKETITAIEIIKIEKDYHQK